MTEERAFHLKFSWRSVTVGIIVIIIAVSHHSPAGVVHQSKL